MWIHGVYVGIIEREGERGRCALKTISSGSEKFILLVGGGVHPFFLRMELPTLVFLDIYKKTYTCTINLFDVIYTFV